MHYFIYFHIKLAALNRPLEDALLVTLDVTSISLHTNSPQNEGIDASRYFLQ